MKRKILLGVGVVFALLLGYLLLWPVPVEPQAFDVPPAPPLEGPYATNRALADATPVVPEIGPGPESVAFDAEGRLHTGLEDGRIVRVGEGRIETVADTGGRPLGLEFDSSGALIVADAKKGLLRVGPEGRVSSLANEADGREIEFANDLDIAADGKIYFSEASIYPIEDNMTMEVIESAPHGRLLVYDPASRQTSVLLDDLYFANGVTLAPDDSYVLVAETTAYRVRKHWLTGSRAGQSEVWLENLPGFPDNVWMDEESGLVWVALASPRVPDVENLQRSPFLSKIVLRLPKALLPAPEPIRHGIVLAFDAAGEVAHNLQDPDGNRCFGITSAERHGGSLYLGTVLGTTVHEVAAP